MDKDQFKKVINQIKMSDIYENSENWKARYLIPSDLTIINLLRSVTNTFLDKLEVIYHSNIPTETKLKQITDIVDELPWEELDTEEREFMAVTLAPAIEAAGFNPWMIF